MQVYRYRLINEQTLFFNNTMHYIVCLSCAYNITYLTELTENKIMHNIVLELSRDTIQMYYCLLRFISSAVKITLLK